MYTVTDVDGDPPVKSPLIHMYTCIYIYIYTYTGICVYIPIFIFVDMYMYVCIYIYTHAYTYTFVYETLTHGMTFWTPEFHASKLRNPGQKLGRNSHVITLSLSHTNME